MGAKRETTVFKHSRGVGRRQSASRPPYSLYRNIPIACFFFPRVQHNDVMPSGGGDKGICVLVTIDNQIAHNIVRHNHMILLLTSYR